MDVNLNMTTLKYGKLEIIWLLFLLAFACFSCHVFVYWDLWFINSQATTEIPFSSDCKQSLFFLLSSSSRAEPGFRASVFAMSFRGSTNSRGKIGTARSLVFDCQHQNNALRFSNISVEKSVFKCFSFWSQFSVLMQTSFSGAVFCKFFHNLFRS